ncbi:hypothetical protein CB1_001105004 [Camelus ferus]|nr:hypothetical protein CB1_001105004 [Camelus ferus]
MKLKLKPSLGCSKSHEVTRGVSRRDGAAGQLLPGPLRTGHAWEPSVGCSHSELREDVQASQAPALSHCDSSLPQRSYYLTQVQAAQDLGQKKSFSAGRKVKAKVFREDPTVVSLRATRTVAKLLVAVRLAPARGAMASVPSIGCLLARNQYYRKASVSSAASESVSFTDDDKAQQGGLECVFRSDYALRWVGESLLSSVLGRQGSDQAPRQDWPIPLLDAPGLSFTALSKQDKLLPTRGEAVPPLLCGKHPSSELPQLLDVSRQPPTSPCGTPDTKVGEKDCSGLTHELLVAGRFASFLAVGWSSGFSAGLPSPGPCVPGGRVSESGQDLPAGRQPLEKLIRWVAARHFCCLCPGK